MEFVKSANVSFELHHFGGWGAWNLKPPEKSFHCRLFPVYRPEQSSHLFTSVFKKSGFILTRDFRQSGMSYSLQPSDFYRSLATLLCETTNIFAFLKVVEIWLKTRSRCKIEAEDACLNKEREWHTSSEVWMLILKRNFTEASSAAIASIMFPLRNLMLELDEVKDTDLNCCNRSYTEY